MRLVRVRPSGSSGSLPIVPCCECGEFTRKPYADLDGKPFESYYCDKCAERIAARAESTPN